MLNRRGFGGLAAGAALWPALARAQSGNLTSPFYASAGPDLTLYDLDLAGALLTRRSTVTLPANVQYAWPHPSRKFLYVAASNGQPPSGPIGASGPDKNHYAIAYRIDPVTGALTPHGKPAILGMRPINICVDRSGSYLLTAYNFPAGVTVHHILADGTIGEEIPQSGLDFGIYPHQIHATPGNKTLTLCSRGNNQTAAAQEDPGHIEVYRFASGKLSPLQSLAPGGNGQGFGPRHLDYSPDGRFVHVSLERENSLCVYGLNPDGSMSPEPLFLKSALIDPDAKTKFPGQTSGPIHVHPSGKFVYQTNRGSGTIDFQGKRVSNGGENNVTVWAINQTTGEPTLVQHAPVHGFEARTFVIDPAAQVLIAATTTPLLVRDGDAVNNVSAGLTLYRIGDDGTLSFVRKLDVDTTKGAQFWCGLLTMA